MSIIDWSFIKRELISAQLPDLYSMIRDGYFELDRTNVFLGKEINRLKIELVRLQEKRCCQKNQEMVDRMREVVGVEDGTWQS